MLFDEILDDINGPMSIDDLFEFILSELKYIPDFNLLEVFESEGLYYFKFGINRCPIYGPFNTKLDAIKEACEY